MTKIVRVDQASQFTQGCLVLELKVYIPGNSSALSKFARMAGHPTTPTVTSDT